MQTTKEPLMVIKITRGKKLKCVLSFHLKVTKNKPKTALKNTVFLLSYQDKREILSFSINCRKIQQELWIKQTEIVELKCKQWKAIDVP